PVPALPRGAAPLPALAAAGLRPRSQPRGRRVPVPARDDRRTGRRRVRVPAAGGAGVGDQRSARMTDLFDPARVLGAPEPLRAFNDAGVLAAADVHVAVRLARFAGAWDGELALAAALAVRAPRLGHVYVDLATIRETAAVEGEEPVDLTALPWPEPA